MPLSLLEVAAFLLGFLWGNYKQVKIRLLLAHCEAKLDELSDHCRVSGNRTL